MGQAFTLLTTAPGADIVPFHDLQIVILPPADFSRWLDPGATTGALLQPSSAGTFEVVQIA